VAVPVTQTDPASRQDLADFSQGLHDDIAELRRDVQGLRSEFTAFVQTFGAFESEFRREMMQIKFMSSTLRSS
jgi:hypothetical protein